MSVQVSASRTRRILATAAATAFAGASLTSVSMVPAQAVGPTLYATEITAPLGKVPNVKCAVAANTYKRPVGVPAAAVIELVVEGPLMEKSACGAYKIGPYWFATSASTVDRAPVDNKSDRQQVRVVARVNSAGVPVADKVTDRKRNGTGMKKDEAGYHLDGRWTAGNAGDAALTIGGVAFNGRSAEADPDVAPDGSAVTVQFTLDDPAAG